MVAMTGAGGGPARRWPPAIHNHAAAGHGPSRVATLCRARMQFLLLLSALLSAVTGAFVGPRAMAAQVSQAEAQVAPASAAARAESPVLVPVQTPGRFAAEPQPAIAAPVLPIAAAPLADIRLNE